MKYIICPVCKGRGSHKRKIKAYKNWQGDIVPCRRCRGNGEIVKR